MVYIRSDRSVYTTGDALLGKFLFKNTSILTFSGLRLALCLFTISPLVEKILLAGTKVAGMLSSCLASLERNGKWDLFACHHFKRFVLVPSTGSLRKRSTSSCGLLSSSTLSRLSPRRTSMALLCLGLLAVDS